MPEVIIKAENVKKRYRLSDEEVWALKGISLDIFRGEFISIMGPSGSGKSTFFNQVGALDVPTEGRIFFEGQSLFMTALQNVMLPMVFQGASKEEATARATQILELVGLGHRLTHKPNELSGGQQQRCAIARALANTPAVILADEPTGNLDTKTGTEIINLLRSLNTEKGVTVICSTHDVKMLSSSHRVCWIRDGLIERVSTGEEFRVEEMGKDTLGR